MRSLFAPVPRRLRAIPILSLAIVLLGSGCRAQGAITSATTAATALPAPTVIPTWTPTPAPTWTPIPTPTPTGLHGRIVFVRESTIGKGLAPVPNLWAVHPDGSRLEQWTFDQGGIGLFYSSEPSPRLVFASATQLTVDTNELRRIPLPERCAQRDELGPACFDVAFSPTGRYVTFVMFPDPEIRGCWGDLQVMDTTTLQVVKSVPSAGLVRGSQILSPWLFGGTVRAAMSMPWIWRRERWTVSERQGQSIGLPTARPLSRWPSHIRGCGDISGHTMWKSSLSSIQSRGRGVPWRIAPAGCLIALACSTRASP